MPVASRSLRTLSFIHSQDSITNGALVIARSFIRSQDSITNGALVIARLQLATGIRPVGHNGETVRAQLGLVPCPKKQS